MLLRMYYNYDSMTNDLNVVKMVYFFVYVRIRLQ